MEPTSPLISRKERKRKREKGKGTAEMEREEGRGGTPQATVFNGRLPAIREKETFSPPPSLSLFLPRVVEYTT